MSASDLEHHHDHHHEPLSASAAKSLDRLRKICLAFPEASEKETWGSPTFRVRDKIFVMAGGGKVLEMTCKALPGAQDVLVRSDPAHFFVPPYVGHNGWVGVKIDRSAPWSTITELAEQAYRMTAPKRIAALLAERSAR